jgi:hypothetical protein
VNRAVARRLAALVSATAVVAGGAALVAPSAHAAQTVTIVSQSSYVDSAGTDNIVGEVRNDGTGNIEQVAVSFQFFNAANSVIGTDSTNAMVERLAPGEKSPFLLTYSKPAGFDHYSAAVSATDSSVVPNHNFTTSLAKSTDAFGLPHIAGTVRNDNLIDADFVTVALTFYDAAGHVVNAASEYVNDDTIAPGGTSVVDETFDTAPSYTSYVALAQSNSDAMPGATPSPSPSSSTTPSPSPSPSPTASPGADTTPTVTLGSSIISAGQRVTVTYHGAPNTTLRILSKTQPATAYTAITAVALDAAGVGTTSHAPTKNTRIMAQTLNGTSSTQPLIQVRSVASINATRVSARTYTFSGRVYPALNNRLVSLYRNGSLFGQGRCDANGVYRITRTSTAGAFSFQARTANDTYNLGTSSPARTFTIR